MSTHRKRSEEIDLWLRLVAVAVQLLGHGRGKVEIQLAVTHLRSTGVEGTAFKVPGWWKLSITGVFTMTDFQCGLSASIWHSHRRAVPSGRERGICTQGHLIWSTKRQINAVKSTVTWCLNSCRWIKKEDRPELEKQTGSMEEIMAKTTAGSFSRLPGQPRCELWTTFAIFFTSEQAREIWTSQDGDHQPTARHKNRACWAYQAQEWNFGTF